MIKSQRGIFEQRLKGSKGIRPEDGSREDCGKRVLGKQEASVKALWQKHACGLGT